ncbi:unnamed protein product [Closterium sp. Yama58-4]|nr:unnamed protein product [Closterium sp. Yama58-4]
MASQAVAPRQWVPPAAARGGRRSKCSWGQFHLQWRAASAGLRSREAQRPSAIHSAGPAFKRAWHRPAASPRGVKALRVRAALSIDAARSNTAVDPFSLLSAVPALRAPPLEEDATCMAVGEILAGGGSRRSEEGYLGEACAAADVPSTPNRLASRLGVLFLSAAAAAAAGTSMSAQAVQAEAVRTDAFQAETVWAEAVQAEAAATALTAVTAPAEAERQAAEIAWQLPPVAVVAATAVPAVGPAGGSRSPRKQTAQQHVAALEGRMQRMMAWVRQGRRGRAEVPGEAGREGQEEQSTAAQQAELRRRVAGVVEGRRATRRKQRGGGGDVEGSGGRGAVGLEEAGSGVGGARLREMGGEGVRLSGGGEWLKGVAEQYGMALPSAVGTSRGGAATSSNDPAASAAAAVVAGRVLAALRQAEQSTRSAATPHPATPPASSPPHAAAAAESRARAMQPALSPLEQKLEEAEAAWQRYEAAVQWTEGRLSALGMLALTSTCPPSSSLAASRTQLLSSLAFAQKRAAEEEQRVIHLRQQLTNSRTLSQPPSSTSSPSSPLFTALPPFQSTVTQPASPSLLPTPSPPTAVPSSSSHTPHPPRSLSLPSRLLSPAAWCPTEAAHTTQTLPDATTTLASTHAALSILQQAPVLVEGAGGGEWAREFVAESVARELSKRRTAHGHAA